ncbi:hypothetical protein ACM26V_21305 [Salipaludibacillus sp. HK11]|uniref:hypothetical protein n=1 Tax=Salipaludibacillus sp. HK11 TaxID=3394320 RepID=UPI0039FBA0D5
MSKLFHVLFISLLSVVLFSALLAGYQQLFTQTGHEVSYGLLMGIYSFYTLPIFILGGIPTTYLINYYTRKQGSPILKLPESYFRSFAMYGIAGILVTIVYSSLTAFAYGGVYISLSDSLRSIILGLVGASIYYHLQLLLNIDWEKLKQKRFEEAQQNI